MFVDGVEVENNIAADTDEIRQYINLVKKEIPIAKLKISRVDDKHVKLEYESFERKFERIRRITGYLVGTIDRWNNAKRIEESERVKHIIQ